MVDMVLRHSKLSFLHNRVFYAIVHASLDKFLSSKIFLSTSELHSTGTVILSALELLPEATFLS